MPVTTHLHIRQQIIDSDSMRVRYQRMGHWAHRLDTRGSEQQNVCPLQNCKSR